MVLYSNCIYLEDKIFNGFIEIENGKIKRLLKDFEGSYEDYSGLAIIPGFIDNHIHGFATGSFWFEKTRQSVYEMQKHLPKMGVTSFLPTLGADDPENIIKGIKVVRDIMEEAQSGAEVIGIHLEGPFINKEFAGMQDTRYCINPDIEIMRSFYEAAGRDGIIKLITIAPELNGAKEVISFCREHGIQVAIGHSAADFDTIASIKDYGIGGVTHMYSGMKGMHHRELSVAGSALYFKDLYCEFAKQTGLTVSHEAFDLTYRLKGSGRIILATDCVGLAQAPEPRRHYIYKATYINDGESLLIKYDDGREERLNPKCYDDVKDVELGFIGSVKNMLRHTPMDMFDLIKITSANAAGYINVFPMKGSIAPGKDADLIIVNHDMDIAAVYCRGIREDIN